MELKAGSRLSSAADTTEVVVVKTSGGEVDLRCGGHPMLPHGEATGPQASLDPGFAGGTLLGKRYTDEAGALEVLCTKAGEGSLAVGEVALGVKEAKPLPSSD